MAEATIVPGVLLGGLFPEGNAQAGIVADAVERVARDDFYGGIEIAEVAGWERPGTMASVEASTEPGGDPWLLEQRCRAFLLSALDRVHP